MKYKHIIWDWNGTLVNDLTLCVDLLNVSLEKRGLPLISEDNYPYWDSQYPGCVTSSDELYKLIKNPNLWLDEFPAYRRRIFKNLGLATDIKEMKNKISKLSQIN